MNVWNLIVGAPVLLATVFAVKTAVRSRGRCCGCSGNCSGCTACRQK